MEDLELNVTLLRRRLPNMAAAARTAGLRPATVSNLMTGKIPVGRAEVRTIAALAELSGCTLDELVIRTNRHALIETGVKALDLLAPLVRGGTAGIVAMAGTGQMVMLAELFVRLKRRGYVTVFWMPEEEFVGTADVIAASEHACRTMDEVRGTTEDLAREKDIVIGVDRAMVISGALLELRQKLKEAGTRPVTVILIDGRFDAAAEDVPYGPLDTLIKLDTGLASRGLFPAVDPVSSTSSVLESSRPEAQHYRIQQEARRLLRRYRELQAVVALQGLDRLPEPEMLAYRRGERLEAFLSQPFIVAEPHTKRDGVWVASADTLEDVHHILHGSADGADPESLRYLGRLPAGIAPVERDEA